MNGASLAGSFLRHGSRPNRPPLYTNIEAIFVEMDSLRTTTHKLSESGIESHTLQRQLMRNEAPNDGQKRFFVIDESSLTSTKQMNEFFHRLRASDRVLLVGDARQHEAVEAGRPYKQQQEAGMETAKLGEIVRQKDPTLKEAVEHESRSNMPV